MKIDFEIIAPDGSVQHTGSFHQYAADERRAFAERIASCQANGYEVRTWQAGARPPKPIEYTRGYIAGCDRMALLVREHGVPEKIKDGNAWIFPNRRRWYRTALVIGWIAVAALAVYAVPHRIHEIVTAHQAK